MLKTGMCGNGISAPTNWAYRDMVQRQVWRQKGLRLSSGERFDSKK